MACCQLFKIPNPNFLNPGIYRSFQEFLDIPCGWCLNCRVDKQNWLSDAMSYEQKKYNYVGSFVTFTYDDVHILENINILPDEYENIIDDDGVIHTIPFNDNKIVDYSLNKYDPRNFLKRLRSKIDYYYEKYDIKNVDLCRKDFKYFMSGEYGDIFGRPHYHFVFFGLDWKFCEDIFRDCWQKGLIDVKPIQSGCFEYVTKYLMKQLHGTQAKEVYDDNNLVRPYCCHSLGLGKGIILDNLDYIKSHNLCYLTDNDKLRPIPIYYRNLLKLRMKQKYNYTNDQMIQAGITPDLPENRFYQSENTTIRYSIKKMNQFRHDQALIRHRNLEAKCEKSGTPFNPLNDYYKPSESIIPKLVYEALDPIPF